MSQSDYIRLRINPEDKKEAKELFGEMGFSLSQAINVFIKQSILDGGLPFRPHTNKVPNTTTTQAIKELEDGKGKTFKNKKEFYEDLGI